MFWWQWLKKNYIWHIVNFFIHVLLHLFARNFANFYKSQSSPTAIGPYHSYSRPIIFYNMCFTESICHSRIVKQYKQCKTIAEITELIQDPDNLLAQDKLFKLFLGYLARIKKLLSEGDISPLTVFPMHVKPVIKKHFFIL